MATVTQEAFVGNFLQLLSAKSTGIVYNDDYREDLSKVTQVPVPFPKNVSKTSVFASDAGSSKEQQYILKFKSIKPPHKFTLDFNSDASNTIYQVKEQLVEKLRKQDNNLVEVAIPQLKLLVKSKVPGDSTQLKDLGAVKNGEVSFMVMVGKAPVSSSNTPEAGTPQPEFETLPEPSKGLELTENIWSSISDVLKGELGDENAGRALDRLKKGWTLA